MAEAVVTDLNDEQKTHLGSIFLNQSLSAWECYVCDPSEGVKSGFRLYPFLLVSRLLRQSNDKMRISAPGWPTAQCFRCPLYDFTFLTHRHHGFEDYDHVWPDTHDDATQIYDYLEQWEHKIAISAKLRDLGSRKQPGLLQAAVPLLGDTAKERLCMSMAIEAAQREKALGLTDVPEWSAQLLCRALNFDEHGDVWRFLNFDKRLYPITYWPNYVLGGLVLTSYGAVHSLAWNFNFPTAAEMWLWRISGAILVCTVP